MQIPIREWPLWTIREYAGAYEEWKEVNVTDPWKRVRALSFYSLVSQGYKLKNWDDVFPINGDKIRVKDRAILRAPTEEENEIIRKLNA